MRKVFKIIFGNTDFDVFFKDTIGGKEPGHLHSSDSRLSLMRFTGVIDKADCEIYEFDIVRWKQKEGGLMPADQTVYTCVDVFGTSEINSPVLSSTMDFPIFG